MNRRRFHLHQWVIVWREYRGGMWPDFRTCTRCGRWQFWNIIWDTIPAGPREPNTEPLLMPPKEPTT